MMRGEGAADQAPRASQRPPRASSRAFSGECTPPRRADAAYAPRNYPEAPGFRGRAQARRMARWRWLRATRGFVALSVWYFLSQYAVLINYAQLGCAKLIAAPGCWEIRPRPVKCRKCPAPRTGRASWPGGSVPPRPSCSVSATILASQGRGSPCGRPMPAGLTHHPAGRGTWRAWPSWRPWRGPGCRNERPHAPLYCTAQPGPC